MAKIYTSTEEFIGNTPLLELTHLELVDGLQATLLAKLEYRNIGGSVKDRVARAMLDEAEDKGLVNPDTLIIEPTSGNTGIGLCAVAAARGYRCQIVMPESMSIERRRLMAAYGAEVILSPAEEGMQGAIHLAEKLARENPNSFIPGQFVNPANPAVHMTTTGPEIWNDTDGNVDIFVAGVGTGGTITGVGKYLKAKNPEIKVVAVEPAGSPVLAGGCPGKHGLQGIGAGFIPKIMDTSVPDEIFHVTEEEAYAMARRVGKTEGLLIGISSGAALHAAHQLALREENAGKTIVVLLPDSGERYLSTNLFP